MIEENTADFKRLLLILEKRRKQILPEGSNKIITSEFFDQELVSSMGKIITDYKDYYRVALTSFSCELVGGEPSSTYEAILMITSFIRNI